MRTSANRWVGIFCLGLMLAWLCLGCNVTTDKIDTWAESVNGEARIAHVVADASAEMPLRVYAVLKLIRVRQFDLLTATMKEMPPADRMKLIQASAPKIGGLFEVPDLSVQAAAKDILYMFMQFDDAQVKRSARQAILLWYKNGFAKKYAAGKFSAYHVLKRVGAPATDLLVELIAKEPEQKTRVKLAKIARDIDHPALKKRVSDVLITWYNEQLPNLTDDLLELACYVRDERLTELLNGYVADKKNPFPIRLSALNSLSFAPSRLSLPIATRLFINRKEHIDLRGIAIEIIRKAGDADMVKYISPFLRDEDVKWAAFAAILKLGGAEAVSTAFDGLNPNVTFWRGDYRVARRHLKKLPTAAAPKLAAYLTSKHVPLVTLALIGLQYSADAALLEKAIKPLADDARPIPNFIDGKTYTLGMMARESAAAIEKRLAEPPPAALPKQADEDADEPE